MKKILVTICILFSAINAFCQENKSPKEHFIVLYTIGENWDTTKEAYEQNYFKEHSSHLAELRNKGKISIGGRFSDTGMLLLNASDLNEAKNLIEKDIAIQNKLFTVEIFYFDAFYKGCIE